MVKNKYNKLLKKYKKKFSNKKFRKIISKLYPIFKLKISKKTFLILLLMICYIFFNKFIFIARTSPEEYIFDEWFFEYKLNESYYKSNEEELLNKAEELREIKKDKDTIKSIFDNFKNKINIFFDNLKNISKDKALENNSIIDNEMKVELLKIDNISHKILDKLSKDNDISSLRKITDHNNTASKTLEYIFNKTNDFKIMENLLNNNNTPTSVINSLAKNEDRDIKLMALSHSNISEDILLKNSKTEDIEVINSLLKNENASLKVLENIVCYNIANEEVLKNITNHPSCNEDLNDFINRKLEIQSANKKPSIKEKIKEKQKIINKNKQEKANTHNNKQANVRS